MFLPMQKGESNPHLLKFVCRDFTETCIQYSNTPDNPLRLSSPPDDSLLGLRQNPSA